MLLTLRIASAMSSLRRNLPPWRSRGGAPVIRGGGVMSQGTTAAPDPAARVRRGHLRSLREGRKEEGRRRGAHPHPPRYARTTSGWACTSAGVPVAIG